MMSPKGEANMGYRGRPDNPRHVIDVAIGILVGLRGCSERQAFDELVRVVNQTGIGIGSTAAGLVALAAGSTEAQHAEAFSAWNELLRRGRRVPLAATT
jgi:ANTAR domain